MSNKVKIGCWVGAALLVGVMVGAGFMFFTKEEDPWLTEAKFANEMVKTREEIGEVTSTDLYLQHIQKGSKTDPLLGLNAVNVSILGIDEEDERKWDLSKSTLQTSVELKLRQAGIKVVEKLAYKHLIVRLLIAKPIGTTAPKYPSFGTYTSSVALVEAVYLARDPSVMCFVRTWNSLRAVTSTDKVGEDIRSTVSNQIDEFLNAYLAANPKEPLRRFEDIVKKE